MQNLRRWLGQKPVPAKLRLHKENGETQVMPVGTSTRGKRHWQKLEETLEAIGPVKIEALTETDELLRAIDIEPDEDGDGGEAKARYEDRLLTKDRREQAAMLDAYGKRLADAFDAGSRAASVSQDHLVGLVETLTENLSVAIVNVHNLSVNVSNIMQENARTVAELQAAITASSGESGGGTSSEALKLVMGLLSARGVPMPAGGASQPNGAPPRKPKGSAPHA